jgi:hypothetical protein
LATASRTPPRPQAGARARALAASALTLGAAAIVLGVIAAIDHFPRGLFVIAAVLFAAGCAWHGLMRRGVGRAVSVTIGAVFVVLAVALLVRRDPLLTALILACAAGAVQCARLALTARVSLPRAARPTSPLARAAC